MSDRIIKFVTWLIVVGMVLPYWNSQLTAKKANAADYTIPAPVVTVEQLGATDNVVAVQVLWEMPEGTDPDAYGFVVDKQGPAGRAQAAVYKPPEEGFDDLPDSGFYEDEAVSIEEDYTYFVKAYDRSGVESEWGQASVDLSSVSIKDIKVVPGATQAAVTWVTSYESDCRIEYGTSETYGSSINEKEVEDPNFIFHSADISNLTINTTYHYKIFCTVADGTEEGQQIESEDRTFKTNAEDIEITHSGRWLGNNTGEITFTTNVPATATLKWGRGNCTTCLTEVQTFTSLATNFSHQFSANNDEHIYYSINAVGDGEDPIIGAAGGDFLTPAGVTINHSVTPVLRYPATQSYNVVFTWQPWKNTGGYINATGSVEYSGPTPGTVNCSTADTICTVTANNLGPGNYTYTITINVTDDWWNPDWPKPTVTGNFVLAPVDMYIVAHNNFNPINPVPSQSTPFLWQTYPSDITVTGATLRGQFENREQNPNTLQWVTYTACAQEVDFSGVNSGETYMGEATCAGDNFIIRGEATIYNGTNQQNIPIMFDQVSMYENRCNPLTEINNYCPTTKGINAGTSTNQTNLSNIIPLFTGFNVTYSKNIAFPWKLPPFHLYAYHKGSDYYYEWLEAKDVLPGVDVGSPPSNNIRFDRIINGEIELVAGDNVWTEVLNNCPSANIQNIAELHNEEDIDHHDVCLKIWP